MFACLRANSQHQCKHYSPQTAAPRIRTCSNCPSLSALLFAAPYAVNASPSRMAWTDFAALRLLSNLYISQCVAVVHCGTSRQLPRAPAGWNRSPYHTHPQSNSVGSLRFWSILHNCRETITHRTSPRSANNRITWKGDVDSGRRTQRQIHGTSIATQ